MKSIKLFLTTLCCMCFINISAQTTYKGVTIDRDKTDNTCITIQNVNDAPVKVKLKYKIGSRETAWIDYGGYIEVEKYSTKKVSVGSKIYGLNLTYVDILYGKQFIEDVGEFFSGGNSSGSSSSTSSNTSSSSSSYSSSDSSISATGSGTNDVKKRGEVIGQLIYSYKVQTSGNGAFVSVLIRNTSDEYVTGRMTGTGSSDTCGDSFRIHPYGEKEFVFGCSSIPGGVTLQYVVVDD